MNCSVFDLITEMTAPPGIHLTRRHVNWRSLSTAAGKAGNKELLRSMVK